MKTEIVYRHFPCQALCGTDIHVPSQYAVEISHANGTLRANVYLVCETCHEWLEKTLKSAHEHTVHEKPS